MDNGKLEMVPPGTVHLDTVRTLHQTVVSLRTALEISKNELKELKEKYQEHSRCIEYTDIIEKLALENHILRRRIIDSGVDRDPSQNINLEVSYTPKTGHTDEYCDSEVIIKTASTEKESTFEDVQTHAEEPTKSAERLEEILEESKSESIVSENLNFPNATSSPVQDIEESEPVSEVSIPKEDTNLNGPNFKTKLELLSKFDVKIKVRTLKEGSIISSTTSDSDSTLEEKKEKVFERSSESRGSFQFEEHREHFENLKNPKGDTINLKSAATENVKMAVPNEAEVKSKTDKFDVQVRITSEENLVIKEAADRARRKDTLNLDVDNLSLRSLSDGDNSVFSEGGTTPLEHRAPDEKQEQENASGNESEEVDDIELIFTTDESKDMSNLQEDLVSIRETDQWAPASASTTHSTPVLIKFHTLDPDFQPGNEFHDTKKENRENTRKISETSLRMKRVSLPNDKEIRHVGFSEKGSLDLPGRGILKSCDNKSDNMLYRKSPNTSTRRLDSVDSLTGEYNRGLSFDHKSSSFELGSSLDVLHREESVDSFYNKTRMGHRFSVFAETDISKCGISEDDLASNLNVRRNTCPNPFAYRPLSRGVPRTASKVTSRPRPVIYQGYAARRESGAQTDVSALPPRWTSDGYLAYKMTSTPPSVVPTLPQRAAATRRLTVPDARPPPLQRRSDEARRVLLSDIGFTSMVPELSRSAEPLWTLRRTTTPAPLPETPNSPISRYRYRSPCLSVDRSHDWIQQTNAPSNKGVPWRGSLPDVRRDDTDELLRETEAFLRRSIDNLQTTDFQDSGSDRTGQPYIPAEARQLRLGHAVKLITPQGRLAVGRVRYVGLAGGTAAKSGVMIGAEFSLTQYPGIPRNDGTYQGRRYFLTPPQYTAIFVPFSKVVMAWAN
ncbi:uncharacterized protein LOC123873517 [Maniola jurtina]|uniref:uncharacterized protein LOC123873517 n=1 Tax=Maniola jurtina TaxID=191418 RepID=UPI001E68A9F2|nr:uncharacterized protein LOC123873517 [Maniola jurtina]